MSNLGAQSILVSRISLKIRISGIRVLLPVETYTLVLFGAHSKPAFIQNIYVVHF